MPWPVTINGKTYAAADFSPYGYVTNFPNILQDVSDVAATVSIQAGQSAADRLAILTAIAAGPVLSLNGRTGVIYLDPADASPVLPTKDLRFLPGFVADSGTFSRPSTGVRAKPSGTIETIASGLPRIDAAPATGTNLGLLIEESRTNLLLYSEQFDNAAWTKSGATVTANAVAGADGTITADKIVEAAAAGSHFILQSATGTATAVQTLSVFARAAERSKLLIQIDNGSSVGGVATIDLLTGTASGISGSGSPVVTVEAYPNGLYRIALSAIPGTGTTVRGVISLHNGSTSSYTGDGSSGLYLWGAQLEPGSARTSYIPTTSASVTRAADTLSLPLTADIFNAAETTIFFEGIASTSGFIWLFDNGSGTNLVYASINPGIMQVVHIAASVQTQITLTPPTAGTRFRLAVSFAAGILRASFNGAVAVTAAPAAVASGLTSLSIGTFARASSGYLNSQILRTFLVPRALSTAALQRMSAL